MANATLTDAQAQQVAAWVAEGLKLSEIQQRIASEFGLRLTYMETRFLLDDLKIVPKDAAPPPAAPPPPPKGAGSAHEQAMNQRGTDEPEVDELPPPGRGNVKVTVDELARPGAVVSGTVTFSDGQSGMWYLDEMGRLGLGMKQKGYRPSATDVEEFQIQLQNEMARRGF